MSFYKYIEGDTFRRIRDDGELGETLVFERNPKGEVINFIQHNNYSKKIRKRCPDNNYEPHGGGMFVKPGTWKKSEPRSGGMFVVIVIVR